MKRMPLFSALAVAAALTAALPAQSDEYVTNSNLRGVVPLATYQFDRIDSVNLGTGAVNLTIGLFSRPGRGPSYSQTVFYSSKIWMAKPIPHPLGGPVAVGHNWLPSFGQEARLGGVQGLLLYTEQAYTCTDSGGEFFVKIRSNFIYTSPAGGTHRFPNRDFFHVDPADSQRICSSLNMADYPAGSSDSGVMELDTSQSDAYFVRFKDGSRESFALGVRAVQDANGNFIDLAGGDTLGRSYPYSLATGALTAKDSSGAPADYVLGYAFMPVATAFPTAGCGPLAYDIQQYNGTIKALTRLTLPSGLFYGFSYDSQFGELTRIDLPTGGYIRYVYTTLPEFDQSPNFDPCLLDSRRVAERRVSPDGVVEHVWAYSYTRDAASGEYTTTVTDPLGNRTVHLFDRDGIHELEREVRQGLSTPLRRFINTWGQDLGPVQGLQDGIVEAAEKNWRIVAADTVLTDTNQLSRTETDYDSYSYTFNAASYTESRMNPIETREFDYGAGVPGPLLRTVQFTWLHDSSTPHRDRHIWDRPSSRTVLGSEGPAAATEFYYDTHALTPTSGIVQHDYAGYPASMPWRGNLTLRRDWLDTEGRWVESLRFYDDLGNLVRSRDPMGNETLFGYADDWEPSPACPPPGQTKAFVTSTTNALGHVDSRSHYSCSSLTESVTDVNGRTTSFQYDLLDRLKQVNAPDGGEHVRFYSDLASDLSAQRNGLPVFRDGGALPLRRKSFTLIESGLDSVELTVTDGLGRARIQGRGNGFSGALQRFDYVLTEYDGLGRASEVSNPRSLAEASDLPSASSFPARTLTFYDALGRVTGVQTPDGQSVATAYSGSETAVTDQTGAARRSRTDALGRVAQVREPDPSTGSLDSGDFTDSLYSYDLLDNLTGVLQGPGGSDQDGSGGEGAFQSRSFLYDSLSRLIGESQPESNTARYAYDDNGNLIERVDARGRRIENEFDALNRIVSASYSIDGDPSRSDPTPAVSYFYDGSTALNRQGRLRSATDGAGTSTFEYDVMGRISRSVRTTRGKTLTADYAYTFLGGVKTASYQGVDPSGFTLVYGYDDQGRQISLLDGGGTSFVTGYSFIYGTTTSEEQTHFANGALERVIYNNRLQPQDRFVYDASPHALMDQHYSFEKPGSGGNNGNIWSISDFLIFQSRSFGYDQLNRLTSVGGPGWGIDYSYDRFGNRLSAVGSGSPPGFQGAALSIDPSTNRIASPGWEYDDAGNVVEDGGARHFVWDSAGRLVEMGPPQPSASGPPGDDGRCTGPGCPPPPPPPPDPPPPLDDGRSSLPPGLKAQSAGTMLYEYDYQDRRVVKDEGGSGRIYFWDEVFGEVIWEFPLEAPGAQDVVRGYFNGRLVVENDTRPGAGLHFMHRDHLGTSKLMTDFFSAAVVCDEVYYPFGQLQSGQPAGCNAHVRKFTGKERDEESGMDYFGARYSDSVTGRFLSPDPIGFQALALPDPQALNRYSYVRNDPLSILDPDGARIEIVGDEMERQKTLDILSSSVGEEAGALLEIVEEDGKFFLSIVEGGTGQFAQINDVASSFSAIINSPEVVRVELVPLGTEIQFDQMALPVTISLRRMGVTGSVGGVVSAFVLDVGLMPPLPGSVMSDGRPGDADRGLVLTHELGHAGLAVGALLVNGDFSSQIGRYNASNRAALLLENTLRRLRNPDAATRTRHNPPR